MQLWSSENGKCYYTFRGHTAEIVCVGFNPQSTLVATGSMDTTAKLWSVQTGAEVSTLAVSWCQTKSPICSNLQVFAHMSIGLPCTWFYVWISSIKLHPQ